MSETRQHLTPDDTAVLEYLRNRVDLLQDERFRLNARPNIDNELKIAIRDLRDYTSKLREQGYNI